MSRRCVPRRRYPRPAPATRGRACPIRQAPRQPAVCVSPSVGPCGIARHGQRGAGSIMLSLFRSSRTARDDRRRRTEGEACQGGGAVPPRRQSGGARRRGGRDRPAARPPGRFGQAHRARGRAPVLAPRHVVGPAVRGGMPQARRAYLPLRAPAAHDGDGAHAGEVLRPGRYGRSTAGSSPSWRAISWTSPITWWSASWGPTATTATSTGSRAGRRDERRPGEGPDRRGRAGAALAGHRRALPDGRRADLEVVRLVGDGPAPRQGLDLRSREQGQIGDPDRHRSRPGRGGLSPAVRGRD